MHCIKHTPAKTCWLTACIIACTHLEIKNGSAEKNSAVPIKWSSGKHSPWKMVRNEGLWSDILLFFARVVLQWNPTPVLLPGKSHGWRSLVRLRSMGSLRVRHDWATSLSLFTFMHWRRKWQPTPVFLPGESQGQWSLVGCCLWGCTESDTTEVT